MLFEAFQLLVLKLKQEEVKLQVSSQSSIRKKVKNASKQEVGMASMSSNNLSSLYGLALLLTWCHTALFFTIKSGRREDGNVISLKVVY